MKSVRTRQEEERYMPLPLQILILIPVYFSKYPRIVLEVFVRKNFGVRYFYLSSAIYLASIIAAWPILKYKYIVFRDLDSWYYGWGNRHNFFRIYWTHYISWYVFVAAYLFFAFKRYLETRVNYNEVNFRRYSRAYGVHLPFFLTLGRPATKAMLKKSDLTEAERKTLKFNSPLFIDSVLEPCLFLIIGLVLWLINQSLGLPLAVSAVLYGIGNWASYSGVDEGRLELVDQMVKSEKAAKFAKEGRQEAGYENVKREVIQKDQRDYYDDEPTKVT